MTRTCVCGGKKFVFIGVQTIPRQPYFLKLYNCLQCKTTVSKMVVPKDHVPTKAVHESVMDARPMIPKPTFVDIADAISQLPI
jgi:hypothetical protein